MKGSAGTLQEIFQDAAQNYYCSYGVFSPMVFYGTEQWSEELPVLHLLRKLFGDEAFARHVLVTDSWSAAADFVRAFRASPA
ncbi:MAG: hypothetical protein HY906_09595 [Deltaproteobacteria bacterium]|nr:hypothetical protein [Deltaproteobacteria bacterium]